MPTDILVDSILTVAELEIECTIVIHRNRRPPLLHSLLACSLVFCSLIPSTYLFTLLNHNYDHLIHM